MAKESGKVEAQTWHPPATQTASKGNFAARPFPEIARTEAGQEASLDRAEMKENQPGGMIENINRSLAAASPPELPTLGLGGVQAKLTLGTPGDVYEQEADRVARQVVDEIHSSGFRASNTRSEGESVANRGEAGRVQRQITVQASGDAEGEISSEWEAQLKGAKSGGQPLSPSVKEPMERAFGADFDGVRVHTGAQADGLARSIQAKAFTTGQDVFFRQGAYEPGSRGGQELIAHELTHVVQQKSSRGQGKIRCMKKGKFSNLSIETESHPAQQNLQATTVVITGVPKARKDGDKAGIGCEVKMEQRDDLGNPVNAYGSVREIVHKQGMEAYTADKQVNGTQWDDFHHILHSETPPVERAAQQVWLGCRDQNEELIPNSGFVIEYKVYDYLYDAKVLRITKRGAPVSITYRGTAYNSQGGQGLITEEYVIKRAADGSKWTFVQGIT